MASHNEFHGFDECGGFGFGVEALGRMAAGSDTLDLSLLCSQ
jgi:hypothetical protein